MKFIHFKLEKDTDQHGEMDKVYDVFNHKNEYLGWIDYMADWKTHKQWIFSPAENAFFTASCLKEIADELNCLNLKSEKK